MNKFKFVILTLKGKIFEEQVDKVIVTSKENKIIVTNEMTPFTSAIEKGYLEVFNNKTIDTFKIKEGFLKSNEKEVVLTTYEVIKK